MGEIGLPGKMLSKIATVTREGELNEGSVGTLACCSMIISINL
jgi:hypothetical protein